MLSVSIKIEGLEEYVNQLKSFDGQKMLGDAIERGADALVVIAQNMPPVNVKNDGYDAMGFPVAPKYGGTMRQMTHSVRTGQTEAEVVADTDYSGFVAYGTSRMGERDFFQWMMDNFGGYEKLEEIVQEAIDNAFPGAGGFVMATGVFSF